MGETLTVDPLMTRITDTLNKAELPSKRSEAIALGVAHYFTGKPSKYGHRDIRRIGGECLECDRENRVKGNVFDAELAVAA